ncbi:MAG: preprotein translocase subunit SecE [Alphaproteobacteria bacterium]|jgi:preprotein translocase subunit SecE|nr:preprotein translocase subunit SecE [Alphaproteobacteria bacterium]MBP9877781.1 preprotein translocase subunit SecE [Alphaproteobacteria bacterium]
MTHPAEFVKQVKSEVKKVTWPSRKETMMTTVMVFIMVLLSSIFFLVVDQFFSFGVKFLLGVGG